MVLQINASNERGIETVRTKIKNFVDNKNTIFLPPNMQKLFKMVILDEIDSMTVEAQGMLRQTIEKNSDTTRFCLICNDIDKINVALQSRCALLRFSPLSYDDMHIQLSMIIKAESIKCNDAAIDAIIKNSKGDLRSATNKLQEISVTENNKITYESIYKTSGYLTPEVTDEVIAILVKLFKSKSKLNDAILEITQIIIDYNVTIFNLLNELKNYVLANKFDDDQKIYLLDNFAQYEIYDSVNVDPFNITIMICSLFVMPQE
jgi:DNA polymerase III delta prime subunit